MSNNIDDIFKEGLGGMEFSSKEELWQQVEKELDKPTEAAGKKKFAYLLLLLCFIISSTFFAYHFTNNKANTLTVATHTPAANSTAQTASTNTVNPSSDKKEDANLLLQKDTKAANHLTQTTKSLSNTQAIATLHIQQAGLGAEDDNTAAVSSVSNNKSRHSKRPVTWNHKTRTSIQQSVAESGEEDILAATIPEKSNALFEPKKYANPLKVNTSIVSTALLSPTPVDKKTLPAAGRKFSLDAVAGSDVFNLAKGAGYYAGLKLNRSFSKGMSVSVGINYSMSHLAESYRLSNKPSQQREADAEISKMVMLRFPVMIEQRVNKSNFTVVAGLTPVYILNAAIYNLPPAFSGNPDNYRKFTINDIRRLNVLFSAAVRYSILRKLAVELSGSYGLTEMVKNSYINQSSVNGNFKNVQVGLVYRLR